MPSIRDVVQALNKRNGVESVLVLGRDGLPIDSATHDALDADGVAALIPSVVGATEKLNQSARQGQFRQAVVETDSGYVIINAVTSDTLLALFIRPDTNVGSLLFELRRYGSAIAGLL